LYYKIQLYTTLKCTPLIKKTLKTIQKLVCYIGKSLFLCQYKTYQLCRQYISKSLEYINSRQIDKPTVTFKKYHNNININNVLVIEP